MDDVLTTGATAGACAEALLEGGASEVALLVAAVPVVSAIGGAIALIVGASKVGGWRGGSSR